jgi:Putative auto-transporter adhesin, head GIN domain
MKLPSFLKPNLLVAIATFATFATLAMTACGDINIKIGGKTAAITGSGTAATATRDVPVFTTIETHGACKLTLRVGEAQSIKITADDNLLPYLTSEVKDGVLVLKSLVAVSTKNGIAYEITAPQIDRLLNSGAVAVNASGFSGPSLTVEASGAGSLVLAGKVDSFNSSLSGVGSLNADKLVADRVSVDVSGVGSAEIRAEKSLKANVSGVGSVKWRGAATDVSKNVSGIGSVSKS